MNRFIAALARLIAQKRYLAWSCVAVVSIGACIGYYDASLVTDIFVAEDEAEAGRDSSLGRDKDGPPPNVQPLSLSSASAALVIEAEDFFTPECAEALRAVASRLEELPQVAGVLWIDRVPVLNIFGLKEPVLPSANASEARFAAARKKAMDNPLIGGQLISRDGRTMLMLLEFDYRHVFETEAITTELSELAMQTAASEGAELKCRVTGQIPMFLAAMESHERNQLRFQLIGYGMILLMAIILFRGFRAVLIVASAPLIGVFWTLGYIRFFQDIGGNPLVDVVVPILVSLVGLTDGVHLMVHIRRRAAQEADRRQAAQDGLTHVGLACFLTSLTTAIGFGSLMLAESTIVQEFGKCSMIGVMLCFLAVVLLIPLACGSWLGKNLHVGLNKSPIERGLGRIEDLVGGVLSRHRSFSVLAVVLFVTFVGLSLQLKPDSRESDGLPLSAEATQAMQHVDKAFGGLAYCTVNVRWSEEVAADSPELLEVITKIDDALRGEELIASPLSMRNLIDAQPGSGPAEERMSMLELLPPPIKRMFYTPEYRRAKVTFRVQDLGIAAYGPTFTRIEEMLESVEAEHSEFDLDLAGRPIWRWRNLYQIVVDLAASLGTASVFIWIVLTIVYRSIRLGAISIVPNLFPLAVTGAFLYLVGYNLEVVMVCSFTVCLGIAVDDTIHFLTRFQEEQAKCEDTSEAIRRAFTGVGSALVMTTAILVAGFSVVTLSDSRDHSIFAIMGALTIASALFCDLVFLPALLRTFAPKKVSK